MKGLGEDATYPIVRASPSATTSTTDMPRPGASSWPCHWTARVV